MTTTEYGRPVLPDPVEVAIAGEEKARLRLQRQRERRERERQAQQVRCCGVRLAGGGDPASSVHVLLRHLYSPD